jgi:hypothetical protein
MRRCFGILDLAVSILIGEYDILFTRDRGCISVPFHEFQKTTYESNASVLLYSSSLHPRGGKPVITEKVEDGCNF